MMDRCEKHDIEMIHSTWGLICPKCREENSVFSKETQEDMRKHNGEDLGKLLQDEMIKTISEELENEQ